MIYRQFMLYILVGVVSAIIDIGTMQLLLTAEAGYLLAVSVGFAVGLVFNYLAHQRLTFKARHSFATVWRYATVLLLNYGLTMLCVQISVLSLDSVLAGKLLSLPLVALNGFVLGRYWIFRPQA
jgi:putative flippase GtrA